MNAVEGLFGWPPEAGDDDLFQVLGVPSDVGNSFASGARFAPRAIRDASRDRPVHGMKGSDRGDLACIGRIDWADAIDAIRIEVESIRAGGRVPILLGGDHAISYPAVAALAGEGPLCVVWFDAHTDMCEWREAAWHNHKQVLGRIARLPHVVRIVQIGHRGITYFDESGRSDKMTLFTAGVVESMDEAVLLASLPPDAPVYISVDIDVLDPRWAPGTGHPVPGGLSPASLMRLAGCIARARRVVGIDLMEVNPVLDQDDMTADAGARVLAHIVASAAQGAHGARTEERTVP